MKQIETNLLKILNAACEDSEFIENIRYLLNADVLTSLEEDLCKSILQSMEIIHDRNLSKNLDKLEIENCSLENIETINYSKMFEEIDKLIYKRREEENKDLIENALEDSLNHKYDIQSLEVFFNRYAQEIKINDDKTLENLSDIEEPLEETISTANEYIDEITGGIQKGNITTIVGMYDIYKSMWALNIAYDCLKEGMNVLYISLGTNKAELYKRFFSRHSVEKQFEKPITISQMTYNKEIYQQVYNDFKSSFVDNLIIFDETYLSISTQYSLQKLIVYAQNKFLENKGKGIDLIVIDDFSNMTIDNGRRTITNRSNIINTYFKYLKNQAKNLLGTKVKIPIITTISASKNSMYLLENNCDFCLDYIDEEVKVLSDIILTIYGNSSLRRSIEARIKVLKSNKEIMLESTTKSINIEYWHMKYSDVDEELEEAIQKGVQERTTDNHIDTISNLISPQQNNETSIYNNMSIDELMEWSQNI